MLNEGQEQVIDVHAHYLSPSVVSLIRRDAFGGHVRAIGGGEKSASSSAPRPACPCSPG